MLKPLPMTTARRAALAIGVPLALLSFGLAGLHLVAWAAQDSYHVSLTVPVHGRTATMSFGSGHITLRPGTAGGIHVTGRAHYAFTRPRVTWRETPSGVIVDSQCHQFSGLAGRCSFDYTVAVPSGMNTHVTGKAGELTASGLAGPLTLESSAGDIRLSALSGDVRVRGRAGEITGQDLTGAVVAVSNEAGEISLRGVASQDVTVTNRAGDIIVVFVEIPQRVIITQAAGDVSLVLPRGNTSYDIQTSLSAGKLSTGPGVVRNAASQHLISVTDRAGNVTITE